MFDIVATTRGNVVGATVAVLLCVTSSAFGQSSAAADALFERGRQALLAGKYDQACSQFRESDRLDPAVGTKLNLADCEEKRGKIVTARELFRVCISQLPANDERLPIAKQRAAALEPRVPYLTLRLVGGAPAGTKVSDGELEFSAASFGVALPRDPGHYSLVVSAPRHSPRTIRVTLVEKQKLEVEVGPGASTAGAMTGADPASDASTTRTIGYLAGGIGAAGILVGGITTAILLGRKSTAADHCDEATRTCDQEGVEANDSGRALAPISTVAWIVGVAGLGAGAYLILSSKDQPRTQVGAHATPKGGGLSLVRQW